MLIVVPLAIAVFFLAWKLRPPAGAPRERSIATLAILIPNLIIAIAAIIAQLVHNASIGEGVSDTANNLIILEFWLCVAALIALIVVMLQRKGEIVKGLGLGFCIAFLTLIVNFGVLEGLAGV
ncbi:hypothetical protein ABFB09_01185 [Dehalogenimonas sp. THU2]|uniref:hypothetical protein n=1 Tax=Dehalogenimonas sp. THU2 TaxID=3151121 RepID=UPI0032184226